MKKQMKQRVFHHRTLLRITQKTLKVRTSFGVQTLSVLFLFVQFHVQYLLVQPIKVDVRRSRFGESLGYRISSYLRHRR